MSRCSAKGLATLSFCERSAAKPRVLSFASRHSWPPEGCGHLAQRTFTHTMACCPYQNLSRFPCVDICAFVRAARLDFRCFISFFHFFDLLICSGFILLLVLVLASEKNIKLGRWEEGEDLEKELGEGEYVIKVHCMKKTCKSQD